MCSMSKLRLWPSNLSISEDLSRVRHCWFSNHRGVQAWLQGPMAGVGLGLLSLRRKYPAMHICSQYLARVWSLSLHHSERVSAERKNVSTAFKLLPFPLSCTSYLIASAVTCLCFPWKRSHQLFWRLVFTAEPPIPPTFHFPGFRSHN